MGRYFSLTCESKSPFPIQYFVTSYWKASPPSTTELKFIAKKLNWNLSEDYIVSCCYDTNNYIDITDDILCNFNEENNEENNNESKKIIVNYHIEYEDGKSVEDNVEGEVDVVNDVNHEEWAYLKRSMKLIKDKTGVFH